jgi:hypothetical protein
MHFEIKVLLLYINWYWKTTNLDEHDQIENMRHLKFRYRQYYPDIFCNLKLFYQKFAKNIRNILLATK